MKKYLLAFVMLLFSTNIYAQKDVTKFMGIPVDGFKQQMFQKLKEKGFVASELGNGYLEGEFNGEDVYVNAVTNNNKVYRIFIKDVPEVLLHLLHLNTLVLHRILSYILFDPLYAYDMQLLHMPQSPMQ